jgi:hypothetical protein
MVPVALPELTEPELTETERLVWDAFPTGSWVDLRAGDPAIDDPRAAVGWEARRFVRAEVLRALLLGARRPEPGSAPAIRLRGARISGRLDLMGATVNWPLVCEYCAFDREIRLVESVTKTVRIVHSKMPAFNGTRMRLDGILSFWSSIVDGILRLDQAKVTGQVSLRDADIGASSIFVDAVPAFGLNVEGGVELAGMTAHGVVSFQVARITGSVDLSRARIINPGSRAFSADSAEIGGRLDCAAMVADGEIALHNTRIAASVSFDGARLTNSGAQALSAGGAVMRGGVHLSGGFAATGEVRLVGAQLAANLTMTGATLNNPGGVAVNLDRATIAVCHGARLSCAGRFSFVGAHIASGLDLSGARIDAGPGERSLAGDGAVVDGMLALSELRARGEMSLRSIRVGRTLIMIDAELENDGDIACRLSGADIAGDVLFLRTSVVGGIRMTGGRIAGRLNLEQVRIVNDSGPAISARALQAGQLSLAPAEPIRGIVDLSHARIEVYRDDPASWPDQLNIDGMTYQALEPRLPARDRLRWLAKDPNGPQSQPYEHLAAHYVQIGQPEEARTVWYIREREQRKTAAPLARLWGVVQDVLLGYGYRPWRALAWLGFLLIVGSVTFDLQRPPPIQPATAPHFNPVIYTLDLLLPLVDLGQRHAFNPYGAGQWLSYVLIAAGWILVTTVAAAAARVLRRV